MKKNRPKLNKKESDLFDLAAKLLRRDPILSRESSSMRRAWCEGFMNGKLYYDHLNQNKKKFYEFWK